MLNKYYVVVVLVLVVNIIDVSHSLSCFVCDSKEDEHCPETWARKDLFPVECGGPDGVSDARFCIKTIAVFGGAVATQRFCSSRDLDNQCLEVKYPQDEKMYYSCTYTCSTDGCNGSSRFKVSSIVLVLLLILTICLK